MERLSDKAIRILNKMRTERLDYESEYVPLMEAMIQLANYEDLEQAGRLLVSPVRPNAREEVLLEALLFDMANKRRCRVCGCTDDCACEGGCSWVEEDLCSVCAGKGTNNGE